MDRRAAGALLALAACFACSAAAPTASNQTALDLYESAPEGCYYNFQHYGEGDRIMTNEPCLNCTCHNRMLMCYLRVCPFTKAIGQDCTVEKRADQCCPIVTCPDVPVDLLTSTSTTSPAEYGATGLGKLDRYGCSISGKYFPEGSKVPPTPNKPCEHCYCIRNMTTCVMQECTLHVDGCTPIYHKDVCCPVRYSCDHPEDEVPLLDDMSTTVRPTPGFLLTTTTIAPVTQMTQDCVHDDRVFSDGALIKTEKACEHCYCMKGDIVCVVQECGAPMENEGKNCTSLPPREGQCCPDTYICEGEELTSDLPTESTTESIIEKITTLLPPRRTSVEGSGYRNEPDEAPYTEMSIIGSEVEGSGDEEEKLIPLGPDEMTPTPGDDDQYIYITTKGPAYEAHEKTTVGINKNMIPDMKDKTVEQNIYLSTTNAPVNEEVEKHTTSGMLDEEILEPHKLVPTTKSPESYESVTTELGDSQNTVLDVIHDEEITKPHEYAPSTTNAPTSESESPSLIEGIDDKLTTSQKEQDVTISAASKPEYSSTSSSKLDEIEKVTSTPADVSNVTPEIITEKEYFDSDITKTTSATLVEESEGPAEEDKGSITSSPDEKEISKPEKLTPSTTSSPAEEEKESSKPEQLAPSITSSPAEEEKESSNPEQLAPSTTSSPAEEEKESSKPEQFAPSTTSSPAEEEKESSKPEQLAPSTTSSPAEEEKESSKPEQFALGTTRSPAEEEKESSKPEQLAPSTTSSPDEEEKESSQSEQLASGTTRSPTEEEKESSKPEQLAPSTTSSPDEEEKESSQPEQLASGTTRSPAEEEKESSKPEQLAPSTTSSPDEEEKESSKPEQLAPSTTRNPAEEEKESFEPEKLTPSATSNPLEEKLTTEPDQAQNTVAVAEEDNTHPHSHVLTTTIASPMVEESTTVFNLELDVVTDKVIKEDVIAPNEHVTTAAPAVKETEFTTAEPDRGLNTIPSEIDDETSSEPSLPERTTLSEETKGTEPSIITDEIQTQGIDMKSTTVSELETLLPDSIVTKVDQFTITTEPSFRKEDESVVSTEKQKEIEPTTVKSEFVDEGLIPTSSHDVKIGASSDVPTKEEEFTTSVPEYVTEIVETIVTKQTTTEAPKITSVVTEILAEKVSEPSAEQDGNLPSSTEKLTEITSFGETHEEPSRIPGEGDCLLNGITYRNNTVVPSTNNCHTGCRCASSIIKCDPIICSPPPDYMNNCQSIYDSPDSCCPTFVCDHPRETVPPQSDNQMSGTESPIPSPTIECRGDQCEIIQPTKQPIGPTEFCTSGSCLNAADHKTETECGSEGCGDVSQKPDTSLPSVDYTEECSDGKCKPESCANGECQLPHTHVSPVTPCEGEHCEKIDEVSESPQLCKNGEDCKTLEVPTDEATPCKGESCNKIDCGVGGCGSDVIASLPDNQLESCKDEDGCKPQDIPIPVPDCTGDEPCRRKEISASDEKLPTICEGPNCISEETTVAEDVDINTELRKTEQPPSEEATEKIVPVEGGQATEVLDSYISKPDDEKIPVKDTQETDTYTTEGQISAEITNADIQKTKPSAIDDDATKKPTSQEEEGTEIPYTTEKGDKEKPAVEEEISEKPTIIEKEETETPDIIEETTHPAISPAISILGEDGEEKPTVDEKKGTEKPIVVEDKGTEESTLVGDEGKEKPTSDEKKSTDLPTIDSEKGTEKPAIINEYEKEKPMIDEEGTKKPAIVEKDGTTEPEFTKEEATTISGIPQEESSDKSTITEMNSTYAPAIINQVNTDIPAIANITTEKPSLVDEEGKDKPDDIEKDYTEKPLIAEDGTEKPIIVDEDNKEEPIKEIDTEKPAVFETEGTDKPTLGEEATENPDVIKEETTAKAVVTDDDEKEKPADGEDKITEKPTDDEEKGSEVTLVGKDGEKKPAMFDEDDKEKPTIIDEAGTKKPAVVDEEGTEKPVTEGDDKKPAVFDQGDMDKPTTVDKEKPLDEEDGKKEPEVVEQGSTEKTVTFDDSKPEKLPETENEHKEKPTVLIEESTAKPDLVDKEKSSESPAVTIEEGTEEPAIIEKHTEKPTLVDEDDKEKPTVVEIETTKKPTAIEGEGTELPVNIGEPNTEMPVTSGDEAKEKPIVIGDEEIMEPVIEEDTMKEESTAAPVITEEKGTVKPIIIDEGTEEPIIEKEDPMKSSVIEKEGTALPAFSGEESTERPAIIDNETKEKPDLADQGAKIPIIVEEGADKPVILEEGTEEPAVFVVEDTDKPVLINKEDKVKLVDEDNVKKPVIVEDKDQGKPIVDKKGEKPLIIDEEVTDQPAVIEVMGTEQPKTYEEDESGTKITEEPHTTEPEVKSPEITIQSTEATVSEIEKTTETPYSESQTTLAEGVVHTYTTESNIVEPMDVSTSPQETPETKVTESEDSHSKVPVIHDYTHKIEMTTESLSEQELTTKKSTPDQEKLTISEQNVEVTTFKVDTTDVKEESSTEGQDLISETPALITKAPESHKTSDFVEKTTETGLINEEFTNTTEIESSTTNAPGTSPVIIEPQKGIEPDKPELHVTIKTEGESTTKVYEEDMIKPIPESHVTEASSTSPKYETSDRVTDILDITDENKTKPQLPELHGTEPDEKTTQVPLVLEIKTDYPEIHSSAKEETKTETSEYSVTEPVRRFTEIEDTSVTGHENIATGYIEEITEHHVPSANDKIDESADKPLLTNISSESDKPFTKLPEQGYQTTEAEKEKPSSEYESYATENPISVVTESQLISDVPVKDVTSYEQKTTIIPDLSDHKHKGTTEPEGYTKQQEPESEISQQHVTTTEEQFKATGPYATEPYVIESLETSTKSVEHTYTITTDIPRTSEKEGEAETTTPELLHTESHDLDKKEPSITEIQQVSTELPIPSVDEHTELPGVQVSSEVPQSLVTEQKESLGEKTTVSSIPKEESSYKPELLTTQFEEISKSPEQRVPEQEEIRTEAPVHVTEYVEIITKETEKEDKITHVSEGVVTEKQDATTLRESSTVTEEIKEIEVTKSTEHTSAQTEFSETTPYLIELEEHTHKILEGITTVTPSEEEYSLKPVEDISTSSPSEEEHSQKPVEDISTSSPSDEEHSNKPVEDISTSLPSEYSSSSKPIEGISTSSPSEEEYSYKPVEEFSTISLPTEEHTPKIEEPVSTVSPFDEKPTTVQPEAGQEPQVSDLTTKITGEEIVTATKEAEATTKPSDVSFPEDVSEKTSESLLIEESTPAMVQGEDNKYAADHKEYTTSAPVQITEEYVPVDVTESEKLPISESDIAIPTDKDISSSEKPSHPIASHVTTAIEEELTFSTTKATTIRQGDVVTPVPGDKFPKPEEKPSETSETAPSSATTDVSKPGVSDLQPTDEMPMPDEDGHFPPSGTSGYGEPDYVDEDQPFGPGTCRYGGKVYVSAQQIPRDDPCDFCFCFRSDIICLQQSCPPPIHGCHEEPIQGFCCPRYECPVSMATTVNVTTTTTTTTTTVPPNFPTHSYKGAAQRRGCQIKGHTYKVGEVVRSSSGPCLHCTCGGDGQMKCDPKACTPEPMLRQMIAAAVSAKRRR